MLEVCHTIAICIDRNRMFANRLNVEYTLDLAVRNVERLNVSSFVMGVQMSVFLIFIAPTFSKVRYRGSTFRPFVRLFVRSSVRPQFASSLENLCRLWE